MKRDRNCIKKTDVTSREKNTIFTVKENLLGLKKKLDTC